MADEPTPASPSSETPPPRTTGGNFRWEPPTAEELQKLMPGYTIEKILGRGGMGAVYRGVQTNLDRPVAIKILPPGVEKEDSSFAERFKSEARLMARLSHPAVVAVYDFGTNLGGQLYFAMEYVDGSDVSQMIAAQGKLPPEHALAITAHVCDALAAAHELGIVHRDIKPANVLLNMKGQVKVADFGLAKVEDPGQHGLTKTGYAMGTPDFVAPEALMLGTAIDGRADLYAVGVMLYQMLTGNIPRGAFKPASVLVPGLDPRFDPIILKAMQHDREERHQNAAELRRELDVILTVPFVRNDAPVSAAIPVAQVAEAPGKRSAAQKPQQRSAGAPTRQPSVKAGEGTRAPETPPKSKTPLFIGLGIAAAIGIGAFVMFGGGRAVSPKPPPGAVGDSAPPTKPASVASSSPKSIASPPPKPQQKPAPAPISQSSELPLPPGQWVKVLTKFEELPEHLRQPQSGVKFEDGWFHFEKAGPWLFQSKHLGKNHAIRARVKRGTNLTSLMIRSSGKSDDRLFYSMQEAGSFPPRGIKLVSAKAKDEQRMLVEGSLSIWRRLAVGEEVVFQFAAMGDLLVATIDGQSLAVRHPDGLSGNGVGMFCDRESFRDIEVINLDGLSEAEALKILGVDERGNDLRKSAAVAATAPAPSVSKSPPLPVPPSSDPKFPPGQWVKLFTKLEELPASIRTQDEELKIVNGWITPSKEVKFTLDTLKARSFGIRAVFRGTAKPMLTLAGAGGGSLKFQGPSNNAELLLMDAMTNQQTVISRSTLPIQPSDLIEIPMEFVSWAGRCIARSGKVTLVHNHALGSLVGMPGVTGKSPVRDIEVINLDGLSEAEALKILGVDEKGNDIRPLLAKQEQQQMEQAKAADAMAAIPELKALHEQFVKLQAERVTTPFEADVAKLNAGYVGGIDREIANEKTAGHLDGVLALEEEKKAVAGVRTPSSAAVPMTAEAGEGTRAPALQKLRGIYREAYAKIEAVRAENLKALTDPLDARLQQIEATLTQQDRIAYAKTVREYREGLGRAAGPPAAASGPAAANTPSTALGGPSALPASKYPKGDDRKAAEWVLDLGGTVKIDEGRGLKAISSKESLPKRSFELHEIDLKGQNGQPPPVITDLTPIAGLRSLRRISVTGGQITDADTDILASLPQLTILDLAYTTKFTGVAAAKLAESGALQDIIAGGSALSGEGLRQISEIGSLVRLNFGRCKITDADIAPLNRLKKLISLRFHNTGITLEGWKQVKDLPLSEIGFNSQTGKMVSDCQGLASLFPDVQQIEFVCNSPITAAEAASLGSFKGLSRLVLISPHLSDTTLEAVAGFGRLTDLLVKSQDAPITQITDEGVAQILKLGFLINLQFEKVDSIGPAIFSTLARHKSLKTLAIRSCPQITDAAIAAFKKERPDVTVTR